MTVSAVQGKVTITTVIPTFNRSKLLSRAIESVKRQTYPDWKLVVVDNASSDDTAAVMAEAMRDDPRIRYHRHAENLGMLANWEFALTQVDTAHFSLLCDDDYLLPDFFEAAAREMSRHPELGLCFGVANVVDEEGKKLSVAPNEMATGYYPAGTGAAAMMRLQHPATPAIVFRTECFRAAGGFDRRSLYVADLDMILRVAFMYPVKFFEEESACYVVHAGNSFKDVGGWHPGLLNLVRNLKRLEFADASHLRKVFRSFGKHAVVPLFAQFLRSPRGRFKPDILLSAGRCLVEMRQVSNTLFGLGQVVFRQTGSAFKWRLKYAWQMMQVWWISKGAGKWRLRNLLQVMGILLKGFGRPGNGQQEAPAKGVRGQGLALALTCWMGLLVFLVVYGLAELVVHLLAKPLESVRVLLSKRRPGSAGLK